MVSNRDGTIKLLIVSESQHEVESLFPVAEELKGISEGEIQYVFGSLDNFYFQNVSSLLAKFNAPYLDIIPRRTLNKPITKYREIFEILTVWINQARISRLIGGFDAVFCGFDGMLQRILIAEAKAQKKPAFQIINALEFQQPPALDFRTQALLQIRKLIKLAMIHCLNCKFIRVPGDIGFGGCDLIFVMGQHVKDVLVSKGLKGSRIVVSGLPRFAYLFGDKFKKTERPSITNKKPFDMLFLPGSFLWHHDRIGHERQQHQLKELVKLVKILGKNYRLFIKVHPREDEKFYDWISENDQIKILSKDFDLYDAMHEASIVLTVMSTGMFEAIALRRIAVVLEFPLMKQSRKSILNPAAYEPILTVDSPNALKNLILEVSKNQKSYDDLLEREIGILDYYIDPKTPHAAGVAARQILSFVNDTKPSQKQN